MTPQGKQVLGIIAEYNPFHNGHLYHIQEAKRLSGCDYLIVVMSGDYVQRGTPALLDKYARTRFALEAGADAVLELPVALACGSAEFFAKGAVGLLHRLGIVDTLCFGCEDADLSSLQQIAELFAKEEPPAYKETLARLLRMGKGYPAARYEALLGLVPVKTADLLAKPNNLLAIEYLRALSFFSSSIQPLPLKREGSGYHDTALAAATFPSATALRRQIFSALPPKNSLRSLKPYLPDFVYDYLQTSFFPLQEEDFSSVLFYALQSVQKKTTKQEQLAFLSSFQDLSPDLAGRIHSSLHRSFSFSSLVRQLSSRNYTTSRIRRALLHLMLGITVQDMDLFRSCDYAPYARLLGMKKESGQLFRSISEERRIPVIAKAADAKRLLTEEALYLFEQDIAAAELYNQMVFCRYQATIPSDYYYPFLAL